MAERSGPLRGRTSRWRRLAIALAVGLVGTTSVAGISSAMSGPDGGGSTAESTKSAMSAGSGETSKAAKPNIVYILTDDLSMNLVDHMSAVRDMKRNGTTFDNFFVADGLCCPSRANILTGRYPHNTGVLVNEGNRDIPGGYKAFVEKGNQERTYAVELDKAGYRTGHLGKYLNGYDIREHAVPAGWDEWHVSSGGYTNVGGTYAITDVQKKGAPKNVSEPKSYLNDLFGNRGRAFVDRAKSEGQPFFLQISSFAPHQRVDGKKEPLFPPAMRDRPGRDYEHGDCGTKGGERVDCNTLKVKRTGDFPDDQYDKLDENLRDRVRMMQSLNDSILELRKELARNGQLDNTYFVFSADNGYHLGEHGLLRGKGSAYDHDTNVPLVVQGPDVPQGKVRHEIAQTVDLYPTFQEMAKLDPKPSNGHGLMALLRGEKPESWRDAALFEHKAQVKKGKAGASADSDPDLDGDVGAESRAEFVPALHPYNAIRTANWLYVHYTDGSRPELYDLSKDAAQNDNVAGKHPERVRAFDKWLATYTKCGPDTTHCWKAGHNPNEGE